MAGMPINISRGSRIVNQPEVLRQCWANPFRCLCYFLAAFTPATVHLITLHLLLSYVYVLTFLLPL